MGKITKRTVEAAPVQATDYIIWDDIISGFGVRIFASGKRSYIIQYRAQGRSRRFTIGGHSIWTPNLRAAKRRCSWDEWHAATILPKSGKWTTKQ